MLHDERERLLVSLSSMDDALISADTERDPQRIRPCGSSIQ